MTDENRNLDRIQRIALGPDEKAQLLMQQLTKTTQDLEDLAWKKKDIESNRVGLIVQLRLLDVSLSTIANVAGISRQRVSQIVEREILKATVVEKSFVTDPTTGELVPMETVEQMLADYESAMKAAEAASDEA